MSDLLLVGSLALNPKMGAFRGIGHLSSIVVRPGRRCCFLFIFACMRLVPHLEEPGPERFLFCLVLFWRCPKTPKTTTFAHSPRLPPRDEHAGPAGYAGPGAARRWLTREFLFLFLFLFLVPAHQSISSHYPRSPFDVRCAKARGVDEQVDISTETCLSRRKETVQRRSGCLTYPKCDFLAVHTNPTNPTLRRCNCSAGHDRIARFRAHPV